MNRSWPLAIVALTLVLLAACQSKGPERFEPGSVTVPPERAVAVVNGQAIDINWIKTASQRDPSRTPAEHLDAAIVAEAAYADAERSVGQIDDLLLLKRQLMVQRMLRDRIEAKHTPASIPQLQVDAIYKANIGVYEQPELRTVDHLLVHANSKLYKLGLPEAEGGPPEAVQRQAHDFATKIRASVQERGWTTLDRAKLGELKAAFEAQTPERLEMRIETNLTAPRQQYLSPGQPGFRPAMVDAFAKAMFEVPLHAPSPVVDTEFGSHILFAFQEVKAKTTVKTEAFAEIRQGLASQARANAYQQLRARLFHNSDVAVDPEASKKLEAHAQRATP